MALKTNDDCEVKSVKDDKKSYDIDTLLEYGKYQAIRVHFHKNIIILCHKRVVQDISFFCFLQYLHQIFTKFEKQGQF